MEPKKMPTLFGLAIVALFVGTVIYLGERFAVISSLFARGGATVQNIEITNITDTSLSVSWTTASLTIGDVAVSGGNIGSRLVLDDRDTLTKKSPSATHYVTIRDLAPDTQYQVALRVNGRSTEGSAQSVATGPSLPQTKENALGPAYGNVITEAGQPAAGAIVYVTVEGSQKVSTIVTPSGSWLIPFNRIRTIDQTGYLSVTERMTEEIVVRPGSTGETRAITDTLNDSPVPSMTTGKSYDFRKQQAGRSAPLAHAVLGTSSSSQQTVALIAPANGAAIPGTTPLIHGTGISGKTVVLTLGINNPVSDTTVVGLDGTWRYTPSKPLGIGKQSVTLTTQDVSGKTVAVTHLFEILKSGTQVLGDATPSATLEPTPTSTLAGEPIPTSGSIFLTLVVVFIGFGLLIAGGALLAL